MNGKPERVAAEAGKTVIELRRRVLLIIHYNVALCNSLGYDGIRYSTNPLIELQTPVSNCLPR